MDRSRRTCRFHLETDGYTGFASPLRSLLDTSALAPYLQPLGPKEKAVFKAFHTLNAFDIPKGAIREHHGEKVLTDYTIWSSAADTKNGKYYYKTYLAQSVESVDVAQALSSITKPTTIVMESDFQVRDRSSEF